MGHVTWPRPFQGQFVIRMLGLAMFNPHIKIKRRQLLPKRHLFLGITRWQLLTGFRLQTDSLRKSRRRLKVGSL